MLNENNQEIQEKANLVKENEEASFKELLKENNITENSDFKTDIFENKI